MAEKTLEVNHVWLSARAYAEQTGLGEQKVVQFINKGYIEGFQTDGGYWKVKVYKNDCVSRELFEKEKIARVKAEEKLNLLKKIILENERI